MLSAFLTVMIFRVCRVEVTDNETHQSTDLKTAHAAEIWAKYINRETGRRSDAATGIIFIIVLHFLVE